MGGSIFLIISFILALELTVECRSISVTNYREDLIKTEEDRKESIRVRRYSNREDELDEEYGDLSPGNLLPSESRSVEDIAKKVKDSLPSGILCEFKGAKPGKRTPCSKGNYQVEWSPVGNGNAADISFYSEELDKINSL